jgi:hypothetical protein
MITLENENKNRNISNENIMYFILGFYYASALDAKEQGLFQDLSAKEVVQLLIKK